MSIKFRESKAYPVTGEYPTVPPYIREPKPIESPSIFYGPYISQGSPQKKEKDAFKKFRKTFIEEILTDVVTVIDVSGGIARSVAGATKRHWQYIAPIAKKMPHLGFVAAIDIPLTIKSMVGDIRDFVDANATERVDLFLIISGKVCQVGDSVMTVASAVGVIWEKTAPFLSFADPLGVGFVYAWGAISLIYNGKSWYDAHHLMKGFEEAAGLNKEASEYTLDDYRKGLQYLYEQKAQNQFVIAHHFKLSESKDIRSLVKAQMLVMEILEQAAPGTEEHQEANKILRENMDAIRHRIKARIRSNQMGIVITTGVIAGISLITFSPLTPVQIVGFSSIAASGALTIVKIAHDKFADRALKKTLKNSNRKLKDRVGPLSVTSTPNRVSIKLQERKPKILKDSLVGHLEQNALFRRRQAVAAAA